jgi:hypothetical protein
MWFISPVMWSLSSLTRTDAVPSMSSGRTPAAGALGSRFPSGQRRQDGVRDLAAADRRCVDGGMDDLIFVGVFLAMMALAFGYVRVCERIVRSDEASGREAS